MVPFLMGIVLSQALLVSVAVYWLAGRLIVGTDKDRVTDVVFADELAIGLNISEV